MLRSLRSLTPPARTGPIRRLWALALGVALGVAAAACGGGTDTSTSPTPASQSSTTTATVTTTTGAPTDASATSSTTSAPSTAPTTTSTSGGSATSTSCSASNASLDLDGRRVELRRPALTAPAPAVVVLHGYTGSPDAIERTSGWTADAAAVGAVVAYPRGTPTGVAMGGYGWDTDADRFATDGVDDVAFLVDVVDALVADHCVDPQRIVLAGESNGGGMALRAACDPRLAGRFQVVAPMIAAVDDATIAGCRTGGALNLVSVAGTGDGVVPYEPGDDDPLLGQEDWFARVTAGRNGCGSGLDRQAIAGGEVITPRGCTGGSARLVAVDDGQHTWPGGPVGTAGLDPGPIDANALILDAAGW